VVFDHGIFADPTPAVLAMLSLRTWAAVLAGLDGRLVRLFLMADALQCH